MASKPVHCTIATVWIDVTVREVHQVPAEVTRAPVEEGTDISDHVRLLPRTLQIEGVVSNHPIEQPGSHMDGARDDKQGFTIEGEPSLGALGLIPGSGQTASLFRTFTGNDLGKRKRYQVNGIHWSKPFDRVRAVDAALLAVIEAKKPVQIVTGLRVYESVVLTDYSVMREPGASGTVLRFGCQGEVIRVVKSGTALVGKPDPVNVRAKPKVSQGNQTTASTSNNEVNASVASKALDQLSIERPDLAGALRSLLGLP